MADYDTVISDHDEINTEFQKLISAKNDLEEDLSKCQQLKSNSKSSYLMFKEITQAVPRKVVLNNIRTSEDDYNIIVVEGQAMEDRPIIELIDSLNSRDTVEKASLVNMNVTEIEQGENNTIEVKSFEVSVIAKDITSEEVTE